MVTLSAIAAGQPESAAALIQARVGQLRNGERVTAAGQPLASTVVLPDFYEQRAFEPAWTDPVNLQALLHAVRDSAGDGLNPRDYHLAALEAVAALPAGPQRDADLDMLATDATLRLAYHLRFGKVDVQRIDANWNFGRDFQALLSIAPVHAIEQTLAQRRVAEALALMRPSQPMYGRLREALARYRALEAAGGWPALASGKALHPGASDRRLPALRARLLVEGDLEQLPPQADEVYDTATQAAVQRFQERHGLKPDAIVGGHTLRTLNVPVKWKIDRLRLSLERARLLLRDLPERYVLVNVPAYRLYYTDGSTRFTSNVVVGKMVAKTPIFRAEITHLVINPSWTVPPGIMQRDILPGLKRDPHYLEKKGLKRVGNQVVQEPGPNNALGRLKIMFPNSHLVYLHDTPQQSLFEAEARTFSSGCIRVQHVFELAELLLADAQRWSKRQLLEAVETGKTQAVMLHERVPILLAYWTAVATDQRVFFYEDVYRRDAAELAALDAPFSFAGEAKRLTLGSVVPGQPHAAELPARMRREEVAIGSAQM